MCLCNIMKEKDEENFEMKIFCSSTKEECEKHRENCGLSQWSPPSCKKYQWNQWACWHEYCGLPASHLCLPTGVDRSLSVLSRSTVLFVRTVSTVWTCWAKEIITLCCEVADGFFCILEGFWWILLFPLLENKPGAKLVTVIAMIHFQPYGHWNYFLLHSLLLILWL